jgi:Ca2+-binding RTX toxin-like protein
VQGLGGNDSLVGGPGFDTLDGGIGADTLFGGSRSDTYVVDSVNDVISETNDFDADDRIQASISIDLNAAPMRTSSMSRSRTGALNATGNSGDNLLIGNAGANILDGHGGADQLVGGAGNDTYIVDSSYFTPGSRDVVTENPGEGTDQVIATTFQETYTLPTMWRILR